MSEPSSSSSSSSLQNFEFQSKNITHGGKVTGIGVFKIGGEGIGWKCTQTDRKLPIPKSDIAGVSWRQIGPRALELVVATHTGSRHRFLGFKEADHGSVGQALRQCLSLELEEVALSSEGLNWGEVSIRGTNFTFKVNQRPDFEVNLSDVSSCTVSKNEVTLKFHEFHTVETKNTDQLSEMRLYVSPDNYHLRVKEGEELDSPAQKLQQLIHQKSGLDSVQGAQPIVQFPSVKLSAPRGKYDLEFHPTYCNFHGTSADFKILYDSVSRVHFLPRAPFDVLVFSLQPPLRKVNTTYAHIIMEFPKDEEIETPVSFGSVEAQKFEGQLPELLTGGLGDAVVKVCTTLFAKSVVRQGSFLSGQKHPFVRCSIKANDGFLYFLDRAFFFIVKPAVYIRYEDVDSIEFTRVTQGESGTTRNFDIRVSLKTGTQHEFNSLPKAEYANIYNFLVRSSIRIKGSAQRHPAHAAADDDDDDEEDDEDEDFVAPEDDDDENDEDFQVGSDAEDEDFIPRLSDEDDDHDANAPSSSSAAPRAKRARTTRSNA